MAEALRVGVVGVGAMGGRIARRLLALGHDVTVWNRTPRKATALAASGAQVALTPGEVARQCDLVITMVSDPDALNEVAKGQHGICGNLGESATWIEMSTVGPRAIASLVAMLGSDARLVEAPVLGSLKEAEEGALVVFVSGPQGLVDSLSPFLKQIGRAVYVGGRGAGAAAKLVANTALLGSLSVFGEALALGERLGLDRDITLAVLDSTPLASQVARRRAAMTTGTYAKRFGLSMARKDAHLIIDAAEAAELRLRLAAAVAEWFDDAAEAGLGDTDYSAVIAHIAGLPVRPDGDGVATSGGQLPEDALRPKPRHLGR